jgi:hypothetical protein
VPDRGYERLAGTAAILAGLGGFIYSVAFIGGVVLKGFVDAGLAISSTALLVGGFLTAVVAVALYQRASASSQPRAIIGLVFAVAGALGAAVHGAYDLANVVHPPVHFVVGLGELPNPEDPRGVLTFGAAGIGLFVLVWLVRRSGFLEGWLANLGLVVGALLVVIYLGRLIILSPTNPVVAGAAGLTGFILSPIFYVALGLRLRKDAG